MFKSFHYFYKSSFSLRIFLKNNIIFDFRYANQLAIGDEVLVENNDEFTPRKVLNMTHFIMQGNHNLYPLFQHVFADTQEKHILFKSMAFSTNGVILK